MKPWTMGLAVGGALLTLAGCGSDIEPTALGRAQPVWAETVCGEVSFRAVGLGTGSPPTLPMLPLDGGTSSEVSLDLPDGVTVSTDRDDDFRLNCLAGPDGAPTIVARLQTEGRGEAFGVLDATGRTLWSQHVVGHVELTSPDLLVRPDDGPAYFVDLTGKRGSTSPIKDLQSALSDGAILIPRVGQPWHVQFADGARVELPDLDTDEIEGFRTARVPDGNIVWAGHRLVRVDTRAGKVLWSAPVDFKVEEVHPSQIANSVDFLADDQTLVARGSGVVTAIDLANGKQLWSRSSKERPAGATGLGRSEYEEVVGGRLLVWFSKDSRDSPTTAVFDARTGKQVPTHGAAVIGLTRDGYVVQTGFETRKIVDDEGLPEAGELAAEFWSKGDEHHG